ncbi:MAG: CoA transferase [Sinobacteraceae bacterium]|nr:CoA transferase [Nevskiaceae bacterium]
MMMMQQDKSGRPCSGIRVLELGSLFASPIVGQILSDLGAEVIKVEPPQGDPIRMISPIYKGMSALFLTINRGKKSVVLDLKSAEGRRAAHKLALSADVLVHNFRPGSAERIGLGYEQLREDNPGLIYASISGFGENGPYVSKPAYDHIIQGMSGVMYLQGRGRQPEPVRNLLVDKTTATLTASSILAALFQRERSGGQGQHINASLLRAFSWLALTDNVANYTFQSPDATKAPALDIHHPLKTRDGWVIGHIQSDEQFAAACKIFDRLDLLEDPRWKSTTQRIVSNGEMWAELARTAETQTRDELLRRAEEAGVALGPIYTLDEFFSDPQVQASGVYVDHEDADFGAIRQINFPVDFSNAPIDVGVRAPLLGEHTQQVLDTLEETTHA